MRRVVIALIFSLLISIPVILPFFHKGYFPTHDGEWAVVRLGDMFRTLRDHQIPVRYSGALNFGYGYPLFNFVYPFPYYLGTLMHFLGFGFVNTVKILFAASVFFSALFMFLASWSLWKNTWAGAVSAIMYVYLPYRMVDLYVRGSIGESLSFVLFPLLFYLIIKLSESGRFFPDSSRGQQAEGSHQVRNPFSIWLILIAISIAVLITTHNIMTVLFLPALTLFIISKIIIAKKKVSIQFPPTSSSRKRGSIRSFAENDRLLGRAEYVKKNGLIKPIILSFVLGFGLSTFFWLPALFEKHYILLSKIPIADRNLYFVKFDQFLLPSWGYGAPTDPNGFSYQLGLPHLIALFLAVFILFRSYFKTPLVIPAKAGIRSSIKSRMTFGQAEDDDKVAFLLIALMLVFIFLLFRQSAFLWEHLPLLREINYPWTALGILGFLVSLLAGFLCKQQIARYIVIFLGLTAIVMFLPYARPQYYVDKGDNYYLTNDATTTSSNELMPLWVKKLPAQRPENKVEIVDGKGSIENISYNSKQISFSTRLLSKSTVRINTIYYPGWKAYVYPFSCHPEPSADGEGSHGILRFAQNDSKCVRGLAIDYQNDKGVMELVLPKGENKVELKFSETPLRLFADLLTLFSFIILIFLTSGIFFRRSLSSFSSTSNNFF